MKRVRVCELCLRTSSGIEYGRETPLKITMIFVICSYGSKSWPRILCLHCLVLISEYQTLKKFVL